MSEPALLLYDADCGFCRVSAALLVRRDREGALRPLAIQSDEGRRALSGVPRKDHLTRAWLVLPGGEVLGGGAAAAAALERIPRLRALGRALRAGGPATEVAYRLIAGNRGPLGRLVPRDAVRRADAILARGAQPPGGV